MIAKGIVCVITLFLCLVGGSQNQNKSESENDVDDDIPSWSLVKEVVEADKKLLTPESIEIFNEIRKLMEEFEGESHKSVTHPEEEDPKLRLPEEKYQTMVSNLEERRDVFAKAFGPNDRRTKAAMQMLAVFHEVNDRHEEARKVYREIGKLSKNSLGIEHRDSLESMSSLARQYTHDGNHGKALDIFRNIYDLQVESLGKSHVDTIDTMEQLAEALIAQSNSFLNKNEPDNAQKAAEEAIKFSKTAYVYTKKKVGENHPISIEAMKNLATTLFLVKEYKRAGIVMEKVYKYYKKNYGKEHEKTIIMLDKLADCLHKSGELSQAAQYYQKVLQNRQANFPPSDKRILTALEKMVMVYHDANDLEKSLVYHRAVYDFHQTYQPHILPLKLDLMENLVALYSRLGQPKESIEFQKKIQALRPKTQKVVDIKNPDPDALKDLEQLAYNEEKLGNTKKALELFQQLLGMYEAKNGKTKQTESDEDDDDDDDGEDYNDDENTFRILNQMALILSDPEEEHDTVSREKALKFYMRLYRYSKKNRDPKGKETILYLGEAGRMHMELKRYRDALKILKKVYKLQSGTIGGEHELALETLAEMAGCYYFLYDFEESAKLRKKIYEANVKKFGKEHLDTIISQREVAMTTSMIMGKAENSLKLLQQIHEKLKNKYGEYHEETMKTKMAFEMLSEKLPMLANMLKMKDEL